MPQRRTGANRAPVRAERCQAFLGCQSPSIAPVGSVMMLNEPAPDTSVTSFITLAPSDRALLVAALMSLTRTWASHADEAPGIGFFINPPPVPSPTLIIV